MKTIEREKVQMLFSSSLYRRGYAYYADNKVTDLVYDRNHDVWTAKVMGTESYFVEIQIIDPKRLQFKSYCDCPAHAAYDECKHIVATLLAISDQHTASEGQPFRTLDYSQADEFIRSLAAIGEEGVSHDSILERSPMHVEYLLKWTHDENLFIELKTGVRRCYVVKDVKELIYNVQNNLEHEFTKNFAYHPEQHYFLTKDLEIFERLGEVLQSEEVYDRPSFQYYHHNVQEGRSVVIPPLVAKDLLELLIERDFVVQASTEDYKDIAIEKETLPFEFALSTSSEDELSFSLGNFSKAVFFKAYGILFLNGIFYYSKKEQLPILAEIMKHGSGLEKLPVTKEQADVFLSAVLPSLRKVGDVKVAEEVANKIIDVPLKAKMYLEMRDAVIYGKLEYHYGTEVIDPFVGRESDHELILREMDREQRIMRFIEQADFHYNGSELYVEPDEEDMFDFLYAVLPQLEKDVELFLTSEVRNFMIDQDIQPSTNIRVDERTHLLDIGFDINGVDQEEIQKILSAVIEKKRYYRLNSGAFLSLESEEFRNVERFFNEMNIEAKDTVNGHIQMPLYRGAEIDELIDTKKVYDVSFRKLLHHLRAPEDQVYPLPGQLNAELRQYQETGYQWFKSLSSYHLGGILADDMGLGKTLQSIAYISSELHDLPHLIVAPSSVVYNWKRECEKFAPHLRVRVLVGTPEDRKASIDTLEDADVWITSYATLRQDIDLYREKSFQTMILDEAQYIKNYRTKTSQAIRLIHASRKFALSGTPIENSIEELWAIFQVVLPGLMPSEKVFKTLSYEKISRMTRPFILRRLKEDVLTELPEKIESVSISELTKEQKDLYLGYWNKLREETAASMKQGNFRENRMKILAGLTRLRQICCHPSLFMENYTGTSGKLEQLLEAVDTWIASGKRMLIFSQFTSMHEILIKIFKERGIEYFYLHGGTKSEDRVDMCERFNNGEGSIFLISLKAGGTGLNLTGADTVILYDLWWNPAVEDQAAGRAHRFGQKNVVQVIRFITEGTIEEKIYELQQKKRELIDAVIQPGEKMLSGLTEDDVRELLALD